MQFCQRHWDALREGIEKVGLGDLISKSGQDAAKKLESELLDHSNRSNFEPLMAAHNMILQNAMKRAGFAVMGEVCPQCFLIEACGCGLGEKCDYEIWTQYAIRDVKKYAVEQGFVANGEVP